jgi:hypothetical protein
MIKDLHVPYFYSHGVFGYTFLGMIATFVFHFPMDDGHFGY